MSFQTTIEIRGYHCDSYGHVNNARYLELFEEARWQFLKESGIQSLASAAGYLFFIVNLEVTYKRPILLDSQIQISTSVKEINNRMITFKQEIYGPNDELCTTANIRFVLFDKKAKKSATISEEVKSWFIAF